MTDQNKITTTNETNNTHTSGVDLMQQAIQKQAQRALNTPAVPVSSSAKNQNASTIPHIQTTAQHIPNQTLPQYPHTTPISPVYQDPANTSKLGNAYMRTFRDDALSKNIPQQKISTMLPKQKTAPVITTMPSMKDIHKPKKDHSKSLLHTYRGDVQGMVKNKKLSLMRMAALESDRDTIPVITQRRQQKPVSKALIILLMFIMVGVIAMTGAYLTYVERTAPTPTMYHSYSLVFSEGTEYVNIAKKRPRALKRLLAGIRENSFYSLGSIVNIALTKESTDPQTGTVITEPVFAPEFLRAISDELPESFTELFEDRFMIGLHAAETNKPFIILKTNDYNKAFAGMLTWEQRIERDLSPFFNSSADLQENISTNEFKDVVMKNVVTRVLRDNNQNIHILYAFIDTHTLVITTNINTLIELKTRLRIAK